MTSAALWTAGLAASALAVDYLLGRSMTRYPRRSPALLASGPVKGPVTEALAWGSMVFRVAWLMSAMAIVLFLKGAAAMVSEYLSGVRGGAR